MTDYREILRLCGQGIGQRGVATSCNCSRNTVSKVLTRGAEVSLSWPLKGNITNGELHEFHFDASAMPPLRSRPDYV